MSGDGWVGAKSGLDIRVEGLDVYGDGYTEDWRKK
jgi:hypothetical protein